MNTTFYNVKLKDERMKTSNYGSDNHPLETEIGMVVKHYKREESKVANEEA